MSCCDINIDRMIQDLLNGGWTPEPGSLWKSPEGHMFYGPHQAWHIWAGTPMELPNAPNYPKGD